MDLDLQAGDGHGVAGAHGVNPRSQVAERGGHVGGGPDLQAGVLLSGHAQADGVEMVGMLVGQQHRVGAVEGRRLGEHPRVPRVPPGRT